MSPELPDPIADDPALSQLIERHGRLELEPADDPFRRPGASPGVLPGAVWNVRCNS